MATHHCFAGWLPFTSDSRCVLDALTHCPQGKVTHYNDVIIETVFMTQGMSITLETAGHKPLQDQVLFLSLDNL